MLGYQLGLHLLKYVYLFSECCRQKQKELEVKRGTEIHNTMMVKVEINRQIEIYISNSRTQEETVEGCVNALKIIFLNGIKYCPAFKRLIHMNKTHRWVRLLWSEL